ncbi:MAG: Rpn family recombination-promoting nuclease/putative transposase [Candidatus Riflebacteria bacterium]|nr:Rpn family recombination-promoting nuclease/putative transposase [Candidatus Riflebacteria bacterium]
MAERELISFDWAMKRVLRSEANKGVLEGFLSVLLNRKIVIDSIAESESNREHPYDKSNCLDIKVKVNEREFILIELQYEYQHDYFQRMLYGTSKAITEHMYKGDLYSKVVKVISINILNFDLGRGKDYVYVGKTEFIGMHQHDVLKLDDKQTELFGKKYPSELYPEYYLIKVKNFDDYAKTPLDEWIYFLKNSSIKTDFTAPGLSEASKLLDVLSMEPEERRAYDDYIDLIRQKRSAHKSAIMTGMDRGLKEGRAQGLKEGRAEGIKEANLATAKRLLAMGLPISQITEATGLSQEEILK